MNIQFELRTNCSRLYNILHVYNQPFKVEGLILTLKSEEKELQIVDENSTYIASFSEDTNEFAILTDEPDEKSVLTELLQKIKITINTLTE
jgi:hypothetical protein